MGTRGAPRDPKVKVKVEVEVMVKVKVKGQGSRSGGIWGDLDEDDEHNESLLSSHQVGMRILTLDLAKGGAGDTWDPSNSLPRTWVQWSQALGPLSRAFSLVQWSQDLVLWSRA